MSLYLDRAHQRAVSFLRYHTGHLRYKWHQLNRIVKELKEESPWLLVVIIVILTVLLVNFIFVTWIACKFIPLWLTLFLQLIALWFIVKYYYNFSYRSFHNFRPGEEFSNQCVPLFDDLRAFLDNRCTRPEQATRPQTAVFMIEGLLRNFDDQTNNLGVTLTEDQQELRDALKELSDWMQATRLEVGGSKKMSFKEYMCRGEFAHHWVKFDKTKHDLARPMEALRDCDRLLGSDDDSETVLSNLRKSFKPQLLGSLYHLRSELINRYHARSFTAEKLDGVYIPSYRQQSLPESSPESGAHLLENKVIVWCNPNAGYYECAVYQHEWLDFYLGLGYGVVLWNYRGFGASKGLCTPGSLCADSETIMQWVATQGAKRGPGFVQRVGVHGRSIGGVTACHFGKVYDRPRPGLKLDFVVADRSFRTLEATARSTFGNWAAMALRLTGTTAHNVDNFLAIHDTPKILMCDPRDTIIPEDANLRTGVAARLVGDLPPELRISAVSRRTLYEASLALAYLTRFLSLIGVDESSESDETSIEELLFILGRSRDDRISTIAGLGASHHRSSSFTSCEDAPTRSAHTTGRYIQLQELGGSAAANSDGSPSSGISDQEANHRPPPQLTQRGRSIEMVTPTDDTPAASIGTYTVEELSSSVTPYLAEMKEILNIIRSRLDAGGQPLADIGTGELPDYRDSSSEHWALTEWLDKMQVWGSLTPIPDDAISVRVKACPYYPRVAEDYARETSRISGALYGDSGVDSMSITPFALLRWHREQAALAVANFSEELSRVVQKMRSAVEHSSATSGTVPAPVAAALWAAMSLENLLVEVRRGFLGQECPNAPAALASSTSTAFTLCPCMFADLETNLTAEDHRLALYDCPVQTGDCWCVHIHCGHNDTLSKVEERELRMHVRYAMSISAGQDDSDQQHQQDGGGLADPCVPPLLSILLSKVVMLGSTSVSAFGRERQNRAQSVLSALLDVLIPEELDLGYADRSKISQFARYNLAHHSFPSVDALAVNRDMKQLIVKVETRGTPVGCGELLAELYLREMPKTALAAGLKDDGDESILPSIISLLLNLSGDPCSVDRATVDRVEEELQREHAEAAARYDHLGRLREGLEEKRMLAAIAQASVETGWELAMAACDSSSDDDEDLADRTTSTASGTSSPGGLELPCFGPFALRGGAAPAVTEDTIMCAADLTRLCQSAPLGAEEAGKEPEDLLAAHVDVAEVLMLDGRRRPWLVPESWVVEEVFTACYTVAVCPPKDNTVISLNTVFHITDDVVRAHPAISKGDAVACKHLTPKALAAALDGIAVIITHVLKLATLPYIPGRYDHRSCFLSLQSEVSSLLSRLIEGLEALQHKYSTSELACTLLTLHCDLLRLATPIVKAALALRGEGPVVQQLWRCRSSGCNIAAALYRACIGPLLASARCMAYDGEVPGDSRDGHKDMVIIIEKVAADPIHPLQLVMAHTMEIPSSAQYGWEVAGHDARAQLMGQSSEAQMLLEHRLGAQAAGCHAVRELLECGSGGAAPLSSVFRALRLVCMAFDEHVQDWLADSGPRGPLWASRYGAWVKPHILTLTGVDIEIDPLGGAVRLPSMSSQQSAILTPLALQFYSEAFRLMQALYEAQSCIIAKPRCCHQGVLAFLYAVRGELLHFVRTLESYLKQSVIDPESRRFDISATKVSSVEALGRLHFHEYLHSSLARSLFMSPRTAVIRDAIMDMLTVCKSYRVLSEKAGILTLPSARLVREATFDSVSSFDASAESYPHSRGTATMEECAVEGGDPTDLISELTELRRSFKASCRGLLNVLAVAAKDERSIFHDLSMGINFCYYYLPPR